ncbi:MAG: alpha/beta fold hydrolase [Candidatus Eremiobacteraeota bacterium]|nr:alpha/beta fold hydrolase [Candidatus Eremiobacteraeota bacterium]
MQVFADDGACIDVRVDGSGVVPIVMIAGFPVTREIWNAQANALARRHRVVLPELRGIGTSSVTDGPYLMERLAADVATVLDSLAIERAAIAGHSLGGYVSLAFARMFTERVSHLALVCSRLVADTPEQAQSRRILADRVERECSMQPAIDAYVARLTAPETPRVMPAVVAHVREMAASIEPHAAAAMLRGMALRAAADDIAPDLDLPVLVIAGGRDSVILMEESRAIADAFPRARLVVCERSGHLPMLEEPEKVSDALAGLLSE